MDPAVEDMPVVIRWIDEAEDLVAGLLMAGLFFVLVAQVASRYVFQAPFSWTEEVARILFVWTVFLGASCAMFNRSHIAIELIVEALPLRLKILSLLLSDSLCLVFLSMLFYWSYMTANRVWSIPTSALELPTGVMYSAVPLASLLMSLRLCQRVYRDLGSLRSTRR